MPTNRVTHSILGLFIMFKFINATIHMTNREGGSFRFIVCSIVRGVKGVLQVILTQILHFRMVANVKEIQQGNLFELP